MTKNIYIKNNDFEGTINIEIEGAKTFVAEAECEVFPKLIDAKEYLAKFGYDANVIDCR